MAKRANHNDEERVTGEAPGTVGDEATRSAEDAAQDAAGPESGELGTGVGHEGTASLEPPVQTASADTPSGHTSTLRLPFVTASFTRTSGNGGSGGSVGGSGGSGSGRSAASDVVSGAGHVVSGAGHVVGSVVSALPRNRVLFYTGVAALGVAGVVEWPVAALVATGTYVASRSRRGRTAPADAGLSASAGVSAGVDI